MIYMIHGLIYYSTRILVGIVDLANSTRSNFLRAIMGTDVP